MHRKYQQPYQRAIGYALLALAGPLLWSGSHGAWQSAVEPISTVFCLTAVHLVAVVVAMLVFVTGYRAILSARKGAVVLLGVAFWGVGLFDFLHTMSYPGMPDAITANTPQKALFFWLVARVLAAGALLVHAWMPTTSDVTLLKKRRAVAMMLSLVGALAYVGLCWPDRVPALFIQEQGLTSLAIGLDWLLVAINLATLLVLWRRRSELLNECVMAVGFAVALSGVSDLFALMQGAAVNDGANVLGNLYKVAAYLYLFHATFKALR